MDTRNRHVDTMTVELSPLQMATLDEGIARLAGRGMRMDRNALLEQILLAASKIAAGELDGLARKIVDIGRKAVSSEEEPQ